jgi:alkanesulfonate monooxygenase SsuD/methylene tetrahydromethanopterin reductase-like flavin-dependent oxidoreductase (luciferase family)
MPPGVEGGATEATNRAGEVSESLDVTLASLAVPVLLALAAGELCTLTARLWEAQALKIGLVLPQWSHAMAGVTPSTSDLIAFGRSAEAMGVDSLWLLDHFYYEPYLDHLDHGIQPPEERRGVRIGAWECWTMLAALASATERVELGSMVTNTGYRNPALLAHMVETVDSLSNGRVILGLGAGDFRSEYTFHGYPWDRRVGRFEEALQIIGPLLKGKRVTFDGEFYQVHDAGMLPKGPRPGGPPILIGLLHGGPRMQRLVAQYADEWNCWLAFGDSHANKYPEHIQSMMVSLEPYGRDPMTLRRNVTVGLVAPGFDFGFPEGRPLTGSPSEVAEEMYSFAELGVDHLTVYLGPKTAATLDWLGEVIEEARKGGVATHAGR